MPPLSLLIKPASSLCNLKCKYCFYHSLSDNRNVKSYGIMDIGTLETLVKRAMDYAELSCTFAFQGGEPTLAGLEFYYELIKLVEKYNHKKVKINYALQTNGADINENWAKFLSENNFLVGLSLDGPKDIHDSNRVDAAGRGSFNKVMKTVVLFNKFNVEYNILSVVNAYNVSRAGQLYKFYKKNNFKFLQFIPCLDPLGELPGGNNFSLKPEKYASFLKEMFDLWYNDYKIGDMVSIRYFDNIVGMYMGYRPEACGMSGICQCQFVVEADGGVYPCDFYVNDDWCLGNVKYLSLNEIRSCKKADEFIDASKYVSPECRECRWFSLCRGECRRNREPFVDGRPKLNYFCKSYKEFFEYADAKMEYMSQMLKRNYM